MRWLSTLSYNLCTIDSDSTHLEANQLDPGLPASKDRSEVILEENALAFQDKAKRASGNTDGIEVKAGPWLLGTQLKRERDEFVFAKNINIEGASEHEFAALLSDR